MADADRVLKILLQMGVVGQEQVQAALTQLQAQATEVAATVKKVSSGEWLGGAGQKITDANVPNLTPQMAQAEAYQAELAAIAAQERTYAAEYAAEWTAANEAKAASQTASVEKTEEEIAAEARLAAQKAATNLAAERRVIIETQIEAAEARIAGNTGAAVQLEREADIRTRSLAIQRALNVTTEESIVLAEKLVQAEEATSAAAAGTTLNVTATGRAAAVLANQLQNGNVSVRTLGTLFGQLLGPLTIAGLAAYEIYKGVISSAEATLKVAEDTERMLIGLQAADKEWGRMAKQAKTVGDGIKLADSIQQELDKSTIEIGEWSKKNIGIIGTVWDFMAHQLGSAIPGHGPRPNQDAIDASIKAAMERQALATRAAVSETLKGVDAMKAWLEAESHLPDGINTFTKKVADSQDKVDRLVATLRKNPGDSGALSSLREAQKDLDFNTKSLEQLLTEQDRLNKKQKEGNEVHREFSALLKGEQNTLQQIRLQQELVSKDPFLSANAKQAALAANARQELATLNTEIQQQKSYIKNTALDPAQLEQAQQKMQEMVARAAQLRQQLAATSTFGGQLKTELAQWGNSFGTTAHQIGGAIQGSINGALQQMNQWILTGKFNLKDLLSSFAQIGLTLVEQFAIQEALQLAGVTTSTTLASTAGADIAASYATAATMVSVATEGQADITGAAGLAAAVAFGQGLSVAHEGGVVGSLPAYRGGPLASDERLVVTRLGETIIPTNVRAGIPRMHSGGIVGGGSLPRSRASSQMGDVHEHYWYLDFASAYKDYSRSPSGRKELKKAQQANRV